MRRGIELKSIDQVRHMRRADLVVADIHKALREAAKPGVTTEELPRHREGRSETEFPGLLRVPGDCLHVCK